MEKIIAATASMRSHQTQYFSTKNHSSLVESKNVEKKVDALLDQYFHAGEGPQPEQQTLFPNEKD